MHTAPCNRELPRFSPEERRLLMSERGIHAIVITRMEQAGYCSIRQVLAAGVPAVVEEVCRVVGTPAWANRRRSLERAMERARARQQAHAEVLRSVAPA